MADKKAALIAYYKRINKPGKSLCPSYDELDAIGIDDPREVLRLNNELIADGVLKRVFYGAAYYGDSDLYLV